MTSRAFYPTNEHGFSPHGFLDKDAAQEWIDDNVTESYRPRWTITNTVLYTDYAEYKGDVG